MSDLIFDATDEGPEQSLVDFMRESYWVCTARDEDARGDEWLRSPARPVDVPNGTMTWRRPTYGEVLNYFKWRERGLPVSSKAEYYRAGEAPRLCWCGHGEDSHHKDRSILFPSPFACRSTCYCRAFTHREVQ